MTQNIMRNIAFMLMMLSIAAGAVVVVVMPSVGLSIIFRSSV